MNLRCIRGGINQRAVQLSVVFFMTSVIFIISRGTREIPITIDEQSRSKSEDPTPRRPQKSHEGFIDTQHGSTTLENKLSQFTSIYRTTSSGIHIPGTDKGKTFLEKISDYNAALDHLRRDILKDDDTLSGFPVPTGPWTMVAGNKEDYLTKLGEVPGVTGLFLDWTLGEADSYSSQNDRTNLLVQDYYPWLGSEKFCHLIKNTSLTRHRWDVVLNRQCSSNLHDSEGAMSIEPFVLNSIQVNKDYFKPGDKLPAHFFKSPPSFVMYSHVIKKAYVTERGHVYTSQHKIVPYGCHPELSTRPPKKNMDTFPVYDEVLSLSQYWGKAFFHKTIEAYPKIAPYLEFLKRNPSIKIQVAEKGKYTSYVLSLLGLEESRLVEGNVGANILYLPRSTSCGVPQIPETQVLAHTLRQTIPSEVEDSSQRRNLVLIRRTVERHFTEQHAIETSMRKLAKEYNLRFFLFSDDPVPKLNETMLEFNRAVMIVAPHGAGLSNLIYSKPGTYVIEGLCNPPHTNLCYTRLSHILGHRYHGLVSDKGCEGVVNISEVEITRTVRGHLEIMKNNSSI